MKRILIVCALLFAGLAIIQHFGSTLTALGPQYINASDDIQNCGGFGLWRALLHIQSNSFFMWRSVSILSGCGEIGFFFISLAILLTFGMPRLSPIWTTSLALLLSILFLRWFGKDSLLYASLSWLPVFILCVKFVYDSESYLSVMLLGLAGTLLAISSNQYAPILSIIGTIAGSALSSTKAITQKKSGLGLLSSMLGLIPALFVISSAPLPPYFDFPDNAHLVPDDGIPGAIRPLIGSSFPIPIIDRLTIQQYFFIPALLTLFVCILLTPRQRHNSENLRVLWWTTIALPLALVLDVSPPEQWAQVGPLATLSRLLPGLFFMPLHALLLALSCLLLLLLICLKRKPEFALVLLVPAILFPPTNLSTHKGQVWEAFAREFPSPSTERDRILGILASPSYYVASIFGLDLTRDVDLISQAEFQTPPRDEVSLSSSIPRPKQLQRLIDGKMNGRWTPTQGQQRGGEWLMVRFHTPQRLRGIELDPGKYLADFPRGLEISYSSACAETEEITSNPESYISIADFPSWQGPLKFSPLGYPFFGAQSEVKVIFPKSVEVQCLRIRQTAQELHFDWSVVEFRVLRNAEPAAK